MTPAAALPCVSRLYLAAKLGVGRATKKLAAPCAASIKLPAAIAELPLSSVPSAPLKSRQKACRNEVGVRRSKTHVIWADAWASHKQATRVGRAARKPR
eukprot:2683773-Prymnesium_polylepis.1